MTKLFSVFGVRLFSHHLPEIVIKDNIKETVSKHNIWGPFYILKGKGSGGG